MADREFSLNLIGGGSRVPMAGGDEFSLTPCTEKSVGFSLQPCSQAKSMGFSLQPCTQAAEEAFASDQSAPKRKAQTSGLDGCATKRKGEKVSKEEPVDSQLTVLEGKDGDEPGFDEYMARIRARYAANVKKMFADYPGAPWAHTHAETEEPSGAVDDVVTPAGSA